MNLILLVSAAEVDRSVAEIDRYDVVRIVDIDKILEVKAVDVDIISEFIVDVFKFNVEPNEVDI